MLYNRILRLISILIIYPILLISCGGDSASQNDAPFSNQNFQYLEYTGSESPAIINEYNALYFVNSIFTSDDYYKTNTANKNSGANVTSSNNYLNKVQFMLKKFSFDNIKNQTAANRQYASKSKVLSKIEKCESGSVSSEGTFLDNLTGELLLEFSNCLDAGVTLNGIVYARIYQLSELGEILHAFYEIPNLTIIDANVNANLSGTILYNRAFKNRTEFNLVYRDNIANNMQKIEKLVFEYTRESTGKSNPLYEPYNSLDISGRIYDSQFGYVDITVESKMSSLEYKYEIPENGVLKIVGQTGSELKIHFLASNRGKLELFADELTNPKYTSIVNWIELNRNDEHDISDSDLDGMHNSWEELYQLDANDNKDRNYDSDGDGFTNIQEYKSGSDPTNITSIPELSDVKFYSSNFYGPSIVGETNEMDIRLKNFGLEDAKYVNVIITLPQNVSFFGDNNWTSDRFICNHKNNRITCFRYVFSPTPTFSKTISFKFMVDSESGNSLSKFTAKIKTNTPNRSDLVTEYNSIDSHVYIGKTSEIIQSLIDEANPGDTVLIPAGVYSGGFNLSGVLLKSEEGPDKTTIYGGKTISIFNGGSIEGFTLVASSIETRSSIDEKLEANISNNKFIGSYLPIITTTGKTIISKNIFYQNKCKYDDYDNYSLIRVGSYSANNKIHNNLFFDNDCPAISLEDISFSANPVTISNNTMVRNAFGIRVISRASLAAHHIQNNLIYNNSVGFEVKYTFVNTDKLVFENNLVYGNDINYNKISNQNGKNGNIESHPLFVDEDAGVYLLGIASPAIDTGKQTLSPSVDLDGNIRPQDGNNDGVIGTDIGAYERLPMQ